MKPLVAALLTVVPLALFGGIGRDAKAVPCGTTTVGGKTAYIFCGPARAAVRVAGKPLSFRGGTCDRAMGYFSVSIGTIVAPKVPRTKPYFALLVSATKEGAYAKARVGFASGGAAYLVPSGKVVLKSQLRSGSFSGRAANGVAVAGTFSC